MAARLFGTAHLSTVVLLWITACFIVVHAELITSISFGSTGPVTQKPWTVQSSNGTATVADLNLAPTMERYSLGSRVSPYLAMAPQDFFGGALPERGTITLLLRKDFSTIANDTTITILGHAPQSGLSTFGSMTLQLVVSPNGSASEVVWSILAPTGIVAKCYDPEFASYEPGTWVRYSLVFDFDGIASISKFNMAFSRNYSVLCSGWIEKKDAGIAPNSAPIAFMAGSSETTSPSMFLYEIKYYDEPMSCSFEACTVWPNNRTTTMIIGIVVAGFFIVVAIAWFASYSRRNPAVLSAAAWKQACLRCEFLSPENELGILQRNAIEDEVKKNDCECKMDPESPASSVPLAVATLGGNSLAIMGRPRRDGELEEEDVLLENEAPEAQPANNNSRWGGVEHDFADSSSESQQTDDEEEIDMDESNDGGEGSKNAQRHLVR